MSTIRSLQLPERVRPVWLSTARGPFAALEAQPARGVADRNPALLVHGYTGSKENFLPVLEPLAAQGRTVIAVDLRGQYQSPHAADQDGYTPQALAADLRAIAAAMADAAGVHLVGHSMGGLIGREAVLQQPDGFLSFTLLGSGPGAIGGDRAAALRSFLTLADAAVGVPDSKERLAEVVRLVWYRQQEPAARAEGIAEDIITFLRDRALRTDPISLALLARYLLEAPDLTSELARIVGSGLPAQVVYGENDDAWPPAEQNRMARRLGAERTCIPGAAHSPAIDAPETTARTLTEFWNAAELARCCGHAHQPPAAPEVTAQAS